MPIEHIEEERTDILQLVDPAGEHDIPDPDPNQAIPAAYNRLLSWKSWVKAAMPYIVSGLAGAVLYAAIVIVDGILDASIPVSLKALVLVVLLFWEAAMGLMIFREHWRWKHEPYFADPEQGVLFQYKAKSRLLGLRGPDPRTIDLDTADYLPKEQSVWETYVPLRGFRHSCTITIDGPGEQDAEFFSDIQDFMYPEELSAIIQYRKTKERVHLTKDQSFQERQAAAAEQTVDLLVEIRDSLSGFVAALDSNNQLLQTLLTHKDAEVHAEESPPPPVQEE